MEMERPQGKTVCAAFAFQNEQQQQRVTTNGPPQYAPVPTEAPEDILPPPTGRPGRRISRRLKLIIAFGILLGVAAFIFFRTPTLGQPEWGEDEEEWAHVHKLYSKRLISKAPGNNTNPYDIPETGLVNLNLLERDYARRQLWERVVNRGAEPNVSVISPVVGNV
jgi:hypothetical protein